jgi:dienelactone hydrolase
VVLIHEIFGLSDWVRSVADQLAEVGYIALSREKAESELAKLGTAEPGD